MTGTARPRGRRQVAGSPRHIAILGGGLAGLSLAVQLLDHGVRARITVVEPRTAFDDDRTWCFWDAEPHLFRHLIAQRWSAWEVASAAGLRRCRSTSVPYARLPSGAVYRAALTQLRAAPNVTLATGVRVERVGGGRVETDAGALDADLVFDSRPPDLPDPRPFPFLVQQFTGRRIALDRPAFDPAACTLMDFRVPQDDGLAFLYLLPFSTTEALAELTYFAAGRVPSARQDRQLDAILDARFGGGWRRLGVERGAIPMWPDLGASGRWRTPDGAIPIGTRAGAPRPSTGYAFLPIQRHARALARRVAAGRPEPVAMRGRGTLWLDRVFLTRVAGAPTQAPALFDALFDRVPAARLARFLSERGSPADHLSVMAALPTGPLLASALQASRPRRPGLRRAVPAGPASAA